jgi:KUP system potassium uptake protein
MATWRKGRRMVSAKIGEVANQIKKFVSSLKEKDFERVKGTAIYMYSNSNYVPPALEKNLKHNQVLHEKIILLTIKIQNIPYLRKKRHWSLKTLGKNFYQIMAEYGYFQRVNVQQLIRSISEEEKKLKIDPEEVTYFLGRENLINRKDIGMNRIQGRLFELMSDNAQDATRFFHLPVTRVFEVGQQVNV